MKPFLLSVCLFSSTILALAQPQPTDPFSPFYDSSTLSHSQKVPFSQLLQKGQMALLSLRQPLNGARRAMVVAWGHNAVLLSTDGVFQLRSLKEVEAMYNGEALVPTLPAPILSVNNAVQVVPISSLGDDAQVVAQYILHNTSKAPLNVSVDSTSCGCTSAQIGKNLLAAGESTTLTATMHASDERMVRVTLSTSDPSQPHAVLALQSKRDFALFQTPSPLSLFGEKGQSISTSTEFELPVGWEIKRIRATPDWLQTQVQPQATTSPMALSPKGVPSVLHYSLTATAPDSAPEGTLKGQVVLELKNATLQSLSVPVSGFISNDISASPRVVVFNESGLGLARRVVVVHGPRPFSIRSVTSNMSGFQARFAPSVEAKAHAVELLVPVSGKKGDSFFERANVELSDGRELPIDISGTVGEGTLPALAQGVVLNAPAPAFSGTDTQGKIVSLDDFKNRSNVLLTFFPHCFTGGCESHLASLRDAQSALVTTNTYLVAVSTDDVEQVRAFAEQLHLPFPILSDTKRQIALAYGAVQSTTDAPSRLTFLIDKSGKVRWIDTDVHVLTHGADVLSKIHELGLDH